MSRLAQNYSAVKDRIKKASEHSQSFEQKTVSLNEKIRLIAVSKTRPVKQLADLFHLGQKDFGENYLQEALDKITTLKELQICWHFIGPIQSNKTRQIAENFDWVHTVERTKIAQRLNDQRTENHKDNASLKAPLNVCIQVNLDNESTKSGVLVEELPELARQISDMPNLCLRGLMFIPKPANSHEAQLHTCLKARAVFDQLKTSFPEMDTISLGMSSDLEAAILAGSNMVRIGTDIFGERKKKQI